MTKKILTASIVVLLNLILLSVAMARDVSLTWDKNSDAKVAGYKIYYKAGSTSTPFDGSGANEGVSPIDLGDSATANITGLSESQVYYFAVTAYDASGNESGFSNIVASDWAPEPIYPGNGDTDVRVPVQFNWSEPPAGVSATYTLYYGTDPELNPANVAGNYLVPAGGTLLAGAFFLGFLGLKTSQRKEIRAFTTLAFLGIGLFLGSCGGSGDTDPGATPPANVGDGTTVTSPGTDPGTTPPANAVDGTTVTSPGTAPGADPGTGTIAAPGAGGETPASFTKVVSNIQASYYVVDDLEPGTKYYWKVVVSDGQNQVESAKFSFTTEAF
jgi:hypothetical protein